MGRTYVAIDLKSFYASVECVERGLDPLNTNLVVADPTRTEKTICLAVSPSLKRHKIGGRARLFEVVQRVKEVNAERRMKLKGGVFEGESCFASELDADPRLALGYITAPPRMSLYMRYSTEIVSVYLKYIAPEDMHVYSIDEVFMDVTSYLKTYNMSAHDLAMKMVREVLEKTGITATAGIGTNMYLCKIAMDVVAKKMPADKDGVRVAELDEESYRRLLWGHRPITDFWRVGKGIAARLAKYGMFTMGDICMCSEGKLGGYYSEDLLYRLFGVNAELLIDHAWGFENAGMKEIKSYRSSTHSIQTGQVLKEPYTKEKAALVMKEMAETLSMDLVRKRVCTKQLVMYIGYDNNALSDPVVAKAYKGPMEYDPYGRPIPKGAHGSINLEDYTSLSMDFIPAASKLFEQLVDERLTVRRMVLASGNLLTEKEAKEKAGGAKEYRQLDLFTDFLTEDQKQEEKNQKKERQLNLQKALLTIQDKYGKNAVLKGMDLEEGATTMERNGQIGGHKA